MPELNFTVDPRNESGMPTATESQIMAAEGKMPVGQEQNQMQDKQMNNPNQQQGQGEQQAAAMLQQVLSGQLEAEVFIQAIEELGLADKVIRHLIDRLMAGTEGAMLNGEM